jgi:uncharacterized protein (TIGR03067 family)
MRRVAAVALVLGVAFVAAAQDKKDAKFDPAKLVGDWTYVEGARSGEKVPKERLGEKVTFTKDIVTVPAGPGEKFTIAYKLNTKMTPVAIDLDIKDGPVKEGKALGIIEMEGDMVKFCYAPDPGKRPTKFESTKENGAFLFVLKRAK